jgi:hypothetical protein
VAERRREKSSATLESGDGWIPVPLPPPFTPATTVSAAVERLAEDFEAAKLKGDEEIRRWASQHLNVEIGVGLQSDAWPGAPF